ncbi:hypothetical protein apy_06810, partial [Aeropyrum pernix]
PPSVEGYQGAQGQVEEEDEEANHNRLTTQPPATPFES